MILTMKSMIAWSALFVMAATASAQKVPVDQLLEMARTRAAGLEQALQDTLGVDNIKKGTADAGEAGEFVWAIAAASEPRLQINDAPPLAAWKAGGLWVYQGKLRPGTAYRYNWIVNGESLGADASIASFGPDSVAHVGVPVGKLTGPLALESKIYLGLKSNIWYYVPAQWDGTTPLAVQVWGDGQMYTGARPGAYHLLETLDNLTSQRRIPLMVNVFIEPGTIAGKAQRSIEYDTVDTNYSRYVLDEVLPEVAKQVKLRDDAYSRAMAGESSGGIASFNAAFQMPDRFARVLSWIGSYTALQRTPVHTAGGAEYVYMVRSGEKRNIRVWMQDGRQDLENQFGSWPLVNIAMANSLKMKSYDFHFSFGYGAHSQAQGSAELPEALTWLWRDYDPAKTSQNFEQEASEKKKPLWRVVTLNRE